MRDDINDRADEQELASLHGMLARHFKRALASGEPVPPATLNAIRQFLKDNSIDCIGTANADLMDIAASLPDFRDPDFTDMQ